MPSAGIIEHRHHPGGVILKDAPTEELTADVPHHHRTHPLLYGYLDGERPERFIDRGLKTGLCYGTSCSIPAGLELGRVNLQDYFISLMNEEDRK